MRSLLLVMIVILALSIPVLSQSRGTKPSFEVATVKPGAAARPRIVNMPGGRFIATGVSLQLLIGHAYRGQQIQLSGGPSWMDSDLWDIEAKAAEGTVLSITPFDLTTPDTMALMVQSLLEDRFQLKMHAETKEQPVYELTIAKGGSKVKLSPDQTPPSLPEPGGPPPQRGTAPPRGAMRMARGDLEVSSISFANFVQTLQVISGRPVIDKTGLKGFYDVQLQWTPDVISGSASGPFGPAAPGSAAPSADFSAPSIFAALQEQLGLKLESAKAAIEVLVLDSAQKPRSNQ